MSDYVDNLGLDISQERAKKALNIHPATKTNGINYAALVNARAKERLAKMKKSLTLTDAIQAKNRYKWGKLPVGLRGMLLERVFYHRGQGMWWYDETLDQHFFLPYALTSEGENSIDFYGQYQLVKPYPFNGKAESNKKSDGKRTTQEIYLGSITRVPVYDIDELEAYIAKHGEEWCRTHLCVIGRDYTNMTSEWNEPRANLQQVFIESQAEILPMMRTAILKACMPKLVKVADEGVYDSVIAELQSVEDSILAGKTMIPVTSFQDLQELEDKSSPAIVETMLRVWESYDNIRKSNLGICNDGAFKKASQILQDEQDENKVRTDMILEDGLTNRKDLAEMVNRLFGLSVTVEMSDSMNKDKEVEEDGRPDDKDVPDQDVQ